MDKSPTYHFLRESSLALLFAFAACTDNHQEPFAPETGPTRPTVENIRLVLNTPSADADTRLDYAPDGYRFEAGDTLTACLMDSPNGVATGNPDACWYDKYTLIGSINTNYPFVRDGQGAWTSSTKLSEGNYFFMYPYNSRNGSRQAYTHTLGVQTLKDGSMASLMRLYAESNFFVGYAPIREGTSNSEVVRMDMRPVFGALGITLQNGSKQRCVLRRVTVRNLDVGFPTTVVVDPTACTYATDNGLFNIAQYTGDDSEAGRANGYEENREGYTRRAALDDLVKPLPGQKNAEKVEVRITDGAEVAPTKEQRLLVMLPQGEYEDLLLEVDTDKGMIHNLLLEGKTTVSTDRKTHRTVSFKDEDLSRLPATNASATDDLARLIRWNVNTPTTLKANLQADIRITAAMYEELRDGKSELLQINLNGHSLVVESDVDETALCGKLVCSDAGAAGKVIVTGRQVLDKAVDATIQNENELLLLDGSDYRIENRGTLIIGGKIGSATVSTTGAVVIGQDASIDGEITVEAGGRVVNHGTLTGLKENAGLLTNLGNVQGKSNTGLLRNMAGEVRLKENTGCIQAEDRSATVITENGDGSVQGTLVITRLAADGNFKVEDASRKGYIVQELDGEHTTGEVNPLANTLWLSGILSGAKDAQGKAQAIDLIGYTLVAVGPEVRLCNEGAELKAGALQIRAGASLTIFRTDVECPTVSMQGKADAPASLVITNLSNLYGLSSAGETAVIGNGTGHNKVENFGGERTRISLSNL